MQHGGLPRTLTPFNNFKTKSNETKAPVVFFVTIQRFHDQWCGRWGCRGWKRTPKSFDLLKIRTKSLKIRAKSVKILAKSMSMFAKCLQFWANYMKYG